MQPDESALIRATQLGDAKSFERLVQLYEDRILRVLYLLVGNRDDAEDIAQETFVKAYRSIKGFRGHSSFGTWLHRIAVNSAHNWMRDNRRRTESPGLNEVAPAATQGPEQQVLEQERCEDVRCALAGLPEHYREAVVLRYYQELSYEEIAEVQQVPIGTVRSRLAKGRDLMLRMLRPPLLGCRNREQEQEDEMLTGKKTDPGRGGTWR